MSDPNEITYGPHKGGYHGEQAIGFWKGSEGYFFVDGPSGGGGHGLTAPGFDGVAYHPGKMELIIYDNKAYSGVGNVRSATAIDPDKNLLDNLNKLINHVETHPNLKDMPGRIKILEQLKQTRRSVEQWIKAGKPAKGLMLPGKVKLVVYNAWGNSTGIGAKLAKSGAIEFIDVAQAPKPKLNAFAEMELKRLENEAERAGKQAADAVEQKMLKEGEKIIVGDAARVALRRSGFAKIMGNTIKRIVASKAAKRTLSLIPIVGWGFSARDAYAGVEDIMAGRVYRGVAGIGFATVDVIADVVHLGDLVSGVGGTVLSLGIQAGTSAGQILIETERVEEKMQELQEEIAKTGQIPSDGRLHDYYDLDDDAINEIKATVGPQLAASSIPTNKPTPPPTSSVAPSTPPASPIPNVAISPKAGALLGAIGAPGARRDWKEAVRLSALAMPSAYEAVQELEAKRMVTVERFGADELNIRFVTRVR